MILVVNKLAYFIHNVLLAHTRNASTKVIRVISHKPSLSGSQYVRLLTWLYVLIHFNLSLYKKMCLTRKNMKHSKLEQARILIVMSHIHHITIYTLVM